MRGDYLVRRGKKGTLYFRWPVPKEAQAAAGRAVVWKSLKTTDYGLAEVAAARLWADLQESVRTGATMADPIFYNLRLAFRKTDAGGMAFRGQADTPEEKKQVAEALRILAATPEMQDVPWGAEKPKGAECDDRKLREVWEDFRKEKLAAKAWATDTDKGMAETLGIFLELVGNKNISKYTRTDALLFKESLQKIPPNRKQSKIWRTTSIEEILRLAPGGQSVTNINKHIANIAAFFAWYDNRWPELWPKRHPFADLKIKGKSKAAHQKRDLITDQQVSRLMPYVREAELDWKFWMIPLGAFTGARVRELAQLLVRDIQEIEGIPVISIIEDEDEGEDKPGGEKRVKTEAGRRIVPVHATLVTIGFLDFVKTMKESGENRLWPDLSENKGTKGGCGRDWSRRFSEIKNELHFSRKVVYHSFRHSVESKLAARNIDRAYISDIIGHARKGDTGETTYTKTFLPERKRAIDQIKYEGVEWPQWAPGRGGQKRAAPMPARKKRIEAFKAKARE